MEPVLSKRAACSATSLVGMRSRTLMLLVRKAHLGEVSVKAWPKVLKEMCEKKNTHVLC